MIKLPEWIKKTENNTSIIKAAPSDRSNDIKIYLSKIWRRTINWRYYPESYFNLYESQGKLTLYHYENNLLIHSQEVCLDDSSSFDRVRQNPGIPIYLILQGQDCEFRTFATKQINIWDRFFLFNQLKDNEFHPHDLIQHYRPKKYVEKIDVLIAVRSNDFLKQVYEALCSLKNPVGGVTLLDIEQSLIMKKQSSITRVLQQWVVTLVPISSNKFTMIVFCQDALLLQRTIYTKNTKEIEKEVKSTLRFLQRQGYKEDQPVSILVPEDTVEIVEFAYEKFEAMAVPNRLFDKETYKPINNFINFVPKSLRELKLAYVLPSLAIKLLVPLTFTLLVLWTGIQIKSFFQDYELKWVSSNFEEVTKRAKSDSFEQVQLGKLFANYVIVANNNPASIITNLNKILKGKFQVTGITWSQGEQTNELRLSFANSFKSKNQDLKKYVNQNVEKMLGDVKIAWDDQANDSILFLQKPATKKVPKNDD